MFAKNKKSWRKRFKSSTEHSSQQIVDVLYLATTYSHQPAPIRDKIGVKNITMSHELTSERDDKQDTLTEINLLDCTRREHQTIAKQNKLNTFVQHNSNKIITINNSKLNMGTRSCTGRVKSSIMRHAGNRSLTGNGRVGKMKQHERQQSVGPNALLAQQSYCYPMMASLLVTLLAFALQQTVQVGSVGE